MQLASALITILLIVNVAAACASIYFAYQSAMAYKLIKARRDIERMR